MVKDNATTTATIAAPARKKPRIPRWRMQGFSVPLWGNQCDARHTESRHGKRGNIEAKGEGEIGEPQLRGRARALRFLMGEPVAREGRPRHAYYVGPFDEHSSWPNWRGQFKADAGSSQGSTSLQPCKTSPASLTHTTGLVLGSPGGPRGFRAFITHCLYFAKARA